MRYRNWCWIHIKVRVELWKVSNGREYGEVRKIGRELDDGLDEESISRCFARATVYDKDVGHGVNSGV